MYRCVVLCLTFSMRHFAGMLDLSDCQISSITTDEDMRRHSRSLDDFAVSGSGEDIDESRMGGLSGTPQLTDFTPSYNHLTHVERGMLPSEWSLVLALDLDNNRIVEIDDGSFEGMSRCTTCPPNTHRMI